MKQTECTHRQTHIQLWLYQWDSSFIFTKHRCELNDKTVCNVSLTFTMIWRASRLRCWSGESARVTPLQLVKWYATLQRIHSSSSNQLISLVYFNSYHYQHISLITSHWLITLSVDISGNASSVTSWKYLTDLHCKFPCESDGYLPSYFYFINCNMATVHCGWRQHRWHFSIHKFHKVV